MLATRSAVLRSHCDRAPSSGFGSGVQAGNRNTVSQSRAAISFFIAVEAWAFSWSQTSAIGAPSRR
ncbi:hypothetical protein [Streptosporangium oxazolinicum]|uniref:hypothetical protein n=1 Tax=Streptosporangium oxazolinicum TaxID=909287 RepID=UPI0031E59DEA